MNDEDRSQFWEDIYLANDTGWDLSGPTPVYVDLISKLKKGMFVSSAAEEDTMRSCLQKKVLMSQQ